MNSINRMALAWVVVVAMTPASGWAQWVGGEVVDGEVPALYRLPPVEILEPEVNSSPLPKFSHQESEDEPYSAPPILTPRPSASITTDLGTQLLPAVQRGYTLAQRGAIFAARTEFINVLRRVAQAKDVATGSDAHAQALAAGLRALDEARDFVPEGVQLEAELDVRTTASSHRTGVLPEHPRKILPQDAITLYHEFAKQQLALAVSGEQAGSMALYGLGRIDAQQAVRKDDDLRCVRSAMTMYAAALAACPQNHLAANELGVLEYRTGRPAEAVRLFQQTIDLSPTAHAYHNLAIAQQKMGQFALAYANEQQSLRLAAWERAQGDLSRRAGVAWVAPEEIARIAQPAAPMATTHVAEPAASNQLIRR